MQSLQPCTLVHLWWRALSLSILVLNHTIHQKKLVVRSGSIFAVGQIDTICIFISVGLAM